MESKVKSILPEEEEERVRGCRARFRLIVKIMFALSATDTRGQHGENEEEEQEEEEEDELGTH